MRRTTSDPPGSAGRDLLVLLCGLCALSLSLSPDDCLHVSGAIVGLPTPTPITGFDVPCAEDATSYMFHDRSGNQAHILPGYRPSAISQPGYLTTVVGNSTSQTQYGYIPQKLFNFDINVDSFIFRFVINKAPITTGVAEPILGNGRFATSTTTPGYGFYFSARPNGIVAPVLIGNGISWTNAVNLLPTDLGNVLDNTDHTIILAYDSPTRSVYMWTDYKQVGYWPNVIQGLNANSRSQLGFIFGSNCLPSITGATLPTVTTFNAAFKNIGALIFPSASLPYNILGMVDQMHATPNAPLSSLSIYASPPGSITDIVGWIGQSNEQGASDRPSKNTVYGLPVKDPFLLNGLGSTVVSGSMFPAMHEAAGSLGKHMVTVNSAVGSTSLSQNWCGLITRWSGSTTFGQGAYVSAAGNIYKFTIALPVGSTAKVGTTNTNTMEPIWPMGAPGLTIDDNTIRWTLVRAVRSDDVLGIVPITSDLFDPNGYFSLMKSGMDRYQLQANIRKSMAISIGQGDKTVNDDLNTYQTALITATNWGLAQNYIVWIGLTCGSSDPTVNSWMTDKGQPALLGALNSFNGNPNVRAGQNTFALLGGPLIESRIDIGVQSDKVHMNSFTADIAGGGWGRLFAQNP